MLSVGKDGTHRTQLLLILWFFFLSDRCQSDHCARRVDPAVKAASLVEDLVFFVKRIFTLKTCIKLCRLFCQECPPISYLYLLLLLFLLVLGIV